MRSTAFWLRIHIHHFFLHIIDQPGVVKFHFTAHIWSRGDCPAAQRNAGVKKLGKLFTML